MRSLISPAWLDGFRGMDLEAALNRAAILASVDEMGWPHQAYLSAGEILARPSGISLALWESSRTTANIRRDGRAVLYVGAENDVWESRLTLKQREIEGTGLAIFDGTIIEARQHSAPYADVLCLLDFKLHDRRSTLDRWQKQIELLRGG